MTKKEKAEKFRLILKEKYPDAVCSLNSEGDPWKLLVMARLSAQCTDERVNIVSVELFRQLPDAKAAAQAPVELIEELIRSCGLYRTKARSIKEMSQQIIDNFEGKVPDNLESLLSLSGVGRKIANLILGDIYKCGGIVADTHCIRICGRLGFYDESFKDPLKTEREMEKLIPKEEQSDFCHRIVWFGRDICNARSPKCENCPAKDFCKHNMKK